MPQGGTKGTERFRMPGLGGSTDTQLNNYSNVAGKAGDVSAAFGGSEEKARPRTGRSEVFPEETRGAQ